LTRKSDIKNKFIFRPFPQFVPESKLSHIYSSTSK
jgi:hypothetical protein